MCFSVQADLVVGAALLPVGVLALREVRHVREVPFASLPLLLALHQLVESVVWAGAEGWVGPRVWAAAALAYVLVALPVLPTLVPVAVVLLEPRGARLRVAPFVGLGMLVSAHLTWAVLDGPLVVDVHDHAVVYRVGLDHGLFWSMLYVVAVIGPSVLSGYRSVVAFGLVNLVGLAVVGVVYVEAFTSWWCVYAAVTSLLVLAHLRRRRTMPDRERLHGLVGPAAAV